MSCPIGRCEDPRCPSMAPCLLARTNGLKDIAQADQLANLRQMEASQRTLPGTVAGYDPQAGKVIISLPGGGIVKADSITNGSLPIGKGIQVASPKAANHPLVAGMPRST